MANSAWTRAGAATACALFLAILAPSCGDDATSEGNSVTPCGNGVCESTRCETSIRCPTDCGTCVGDCPLVGDMKPGTCGKPCSSSCDCHHPGEMCSADYGASPGACLPIACRNCNSKQTCNFTPDANGICPEQVTCQ